MSIRKRLLGIGVLIAVVGLMSPAPARALPTDPEIANPDRALLKQQGIDIAPKGPVHEAFARPYEQDPKPTPPALKEPPPPIREVPPEQRPEGDNVQWIPGYWAWDGEKKDFLWVSGMYRNMPQGRKYIPGYWTQGNDGWQWVPGFFAPAQQAETQYVPQPPASLDIGPSSPPPDQNSFYTPGIWSYDGSQFAWRPGYWSPYQTGMIWTPSSYTWTPAGWVFVPGYWDYALANRGLLFAPAYFNGPYWNNPNWYYQPSFALGLGSPWNYGLFYQNGYPSYFYGPYYGGIGLGFGLGFSPWWGGPFWGNPLFGYYRWYHRGNPGWWNGMRNMYANRGLSPVPVANINSINNLRNIRDFSPTRLTNMSAAQVAAQRTTATQFRQLAMNRGRLEGAAVGHGVGAKSLRLNSANSANAGTAIRSGNAGAAVRNGNAVAHTNTLRNPTFNSPNLRTPTFNSGLKQQNYVGRQGLTGHAPAANGGYQANLRNPTYNYSAGNGYHAKSGITGTQHYSTQAYNPPRANPSMYSHSGVGSYLYRGGNSYGGYRPSATYHPSTTYHPSMPMYHGGAGYGGRSFGGYGGHSIGGHSIGGHSIGGHMGGGHMGGGHMGGGHGGGHR